jgi:GSH-dependent disulfide-bond oxidoreductase
MADAPDPALNQPSGYVPPAVWTFEAPSGGQFANINRPVSGATHEAALPVGKHKLQLYSLGTPNGVKVTIMLEELLARGHADADYDAWLIRIMNGDQFGSGFVAANPNSKIPAMMDHSVDPPIRLFESGSILVYLAEKFGAFLPTEARQRAETFNWLMWQMGSAPFVGGGFGHFFAYAPFKMEYPINRYAMETKRQLHVLDTHLATHEYMAGADYTIADMAIWPWYGGIMREAYGAQEFLSVGEYTHLDRWVEQVAARPAVQRGRMVNRTSGAPEAQLLERHDAKDFETNREDMVQARGGTRI